VRDLAKIRALHDGTLPERERVEPGARLAREPELARLADSYRLVARATAGPAPARRTAFADLPLRRRWPWAAAAAAAIALAFLVFDREPPPPVKLTAIPLERVEAPPVPDWPRALADYETAGEDGLLWLDDEREARALARAGNRPLFVFPHFPQCPLCRKYFDETFRDREVVEAAKSFVLLEVDVRRAPGWVLHDLPRAWPILGIHEPDGRRVTALTGLRSAPQVARWLGGVAAERTDLFEAARKLKRAEQAEPAERLRLWKELERDLPGDWPGEVARAMRLAMEARAQEALFGDADPAAVARELEGTPYAEDLRRVAKHMEKYGERPRLER